MIRTGGFSRISDFMLYQLAFTELFFLNKLWPDISKSDIAKIMKGTLKLIENLDYSIDRLKIGLIILFLYQ